jgi:hypothetical protein
MTRLSVRYAGAATGAAEDLVVVTNRSTAPCTLLGYARLRFLDGMTPIRVSITHGAGKFFPAIKPVPVAIAPGEAASFFVAYSDAGAHGGACEIHATALAVTLPGDNEAINAPLDPHQLSYPCTQSAVSEPFIAGASAKGWT